MKCFFILLQLIGYTWSQTINASQKEIHRSSRTKDLEEMVDKEAPLYGYLCDDIEMVQEFSLHDVETCNFDPIDHKIEESGRYQILQLAKHQHVKVKRCQVTYEVSSYTCSWDYGAFPVHGPMKQVEELTPLECEILHERQMFKAGDGEYYETTVNKTSMFHVNLVGYINSDGDCMGSSGQDAQGRHFDYLVKMADYEVKLVERNGLLNTQTNTITFSQGGEQFTCPTTNRHCINVYGTFVWDINNRRNCPVQPIREISGVIHKAKDMPTVLIGDEKSLVFLELLHQEHVCNKQVYMTNVDRVMVLKVGSGVMPFTNSRVIPENVDLFLNMDIKLTWAYNSVLAKSEVLYTKIIKYICEEQRARLMDKLKLLRTLAEITDITVSNQEGTQITIVGEVVYESKCKQVQVTIRPLDYCTNELPITISSPLPNLLEEQAFLTPVSRIITFNASEITCSALFPPKFKYGPNTWITYGTKVAETTAPEIVPLKDYEMIRYKPVTAFTSGGIYSPEDIQKAKELLLYPTLLRASQNAMVRRINFKTTHNRIDLSPLISPQEFKTAFQNFLHKTLGVLSIIGQYAAAFYTIYLMYHLLTAALKTMISAKSIYKLYGRSTKLLYALCSCTRLIFLHEELKKPAHNEKPKSIEYTPPGTPKWRFPHDHTAKPTCPTQPSEENEADNFEWPNPPKDMERELKYDVPKRLISKRGSYYPGIYPILKKVRFESAPDLMEMEQLHQPKPPVEESDSLSLK